MPRQPLVELNVTIVQNPSMIVQKTTITLKNEYLPDFAYMFAEVGTICHEQPFRIYCRISEYEYVSVFNFISFKGGLELICNPRIYVVVDEPIIEIQSYQSKTTIGTRSDCEKLSSSSSDEYDFSCEISNGSSLCWMLSDVEILQCALSIIKECDEDPGAPFRYLFVKTPPLYGRELKDTDRQIKILMKGEFDTIILLDGRVKHKLKLFREAMYFFEFAYEIDIIEEKTKFVENLLRQMLSNFSTLLGFPQPKEKPPQVPFPEVKRVRSFSTIKSSKKKKK
ncbi:hypothetical protein ANTRET_LOCUS5049 [Anthophora retusa]